MFQILGSIVLFILNIVLWILVYLMFKQGYPLKYKLVIVPVCLLATYAIMSLVGTNFNYKYYEEPIRSEIFVNSNTTVVYDSTRNTYSAVTGYFTPDSFYKQDNQLMLKSVCRTGHWTLGGSQTYEYMRFIFIGKSPDSKFYIVRDVPVEDIKIYKTSN